MKRKKHLYDIGQYADEIYTQPYEDTREERIDAALRTNKRISHYRLKTIISGPMVESEIYPVWETRKCAPPKPKKKSTPQAQRNLNEKNARKTFVRLLNTNFTEGDVWATFTYDDEHLPSSREGALKEFQRYIKRLSEYCKKHNLPPLKYLHVMPDDEVIEKKHRFHHHLVINFPDRDILEKLWKAGGRKNTRRLQPDDFNFEGLGRYLASHGRRWTCSLNLKKPKITIADTKFRSLRSVEKMLIPTEAEEKLKKLYPDFIQLETPKIYVNDIYGGYYIYTRMRRQI